MGNIIQSQIFSKSGIKIYQGCFKSCEFYSFLLALISIIITYIKEQMYNQRLLIEAECYKFPPLKVHKISRKFCYLSKKNKKYPLSTEELLEMKVKSTKSLTQRLRTQIEQDWHNETAKKTSVSPGKGGSYIKLISQTQTLQPYSNLNPQQSIILTQQSVKKANHSLPVKQSYSPRILIPEESFNQKQRKTIQTLRQKIQQVVKTQRSQISQRKNKIGKQVDQIFLHPFHLTRKRNLAPTLSSSRYKPQYVGKFSQILKLPIKQIAQISINQSIKSK